MFDERCFAIQSRPNDFDVLGHVNNAMVLQYLEAARWDWLRGEKLGQGKVVSVVTRIDIRYLRELRLDDASGFAVRTTLQRAGGMEDDRGADPWDVYKCQFVQRVVAGGAIAADARVDVAFIDADSRALCSLGAFIEAGRGA